MRKIKVLFGCCGEHVRIDVGDQIRLTYLYLTEPEAKELVKEGF